MPMKINNTYIIEKFEDIPINDLPIGQQIMLFEQSEDNQTQRMVDKTTNMILECVEMGILYNFAANIAKPEFCLDDDKYKEVTEKLGEEAVENLSQDQYVELSVSCTDYISYVTCDSEYIKMIKIGNKLHHLNIDSKGGFSPKQGGYRRNYTINDNEKYKKLYDRIFEWSTNYNINISSYSQNNIFTQFLSIPFEGGKVAMVFVFDHDIRPEYRYWNITQHVYLIGNDGNIIELSVPIKYIYDIIKQYKNGYEKEFEKFDKIIFANEYDIRDLIKDGGRGLSDVKLAFIDDNFQFYNTIDKFYSPYFVDGEISVYPDSARIKETCYNHPLIVKDGKKVGWTAEEEYPDHYRVGREIYEFIKYRGFGINPKTGEIENRNNLVKVYGDDEGFIIKTVDDYQHNKHIYIKKLGFFIKADEERDKKEIEELNERRKLMEDMAAAAPINKTV